MDTDAFGKRLAATRRQRRLTQTELARRATLSVAFLSELENGHREPGASSLLRLADALLVSLDYLLRGHEFGYATQSVASDREPRSLFT